MFIVNISLSQKETFLPIIKNILRKVVQYISYLHLIYTLHRLKIIIFSLNSLFKSLTFIIIFILLFWIEKKLPAQKLTRKKKHSSNISYEQFPVLLQNWNGTLPFKKVKEYILNIDFRKCIRTENIISKIAINDSIKAGNVPNPLCSTLCSPLYEFIYILQTSLRS